MQQRLYFSTLLLMIGLFPLSKGITSAPPPSFERDIFPIIQQKCAVATCHGQSQRPYFSDYTAIEKKATHIEKRITNDRRPMPPTDAEVSLSPDEQQLILDWITAGAPNN